MKRFPAKSTLFLFIIISTILILAACAQAESTEPQAAEESAPQEAEEAAPAEEAEAPAEEAPAQESAPTAEEAAPQAEEAAPAPEAAPGGAFAVSLDHPAAPFLESRAYAAANGATAEWRKMEGVAVDPANRRFYMAITEVAAGMSDGEGAIQLEENPCGAVYMGELDANWNVASLTPIVVGGPYDEANTESPCNPDNIAHPDNVAVDAAGRLWISEDSDGNHANDMLWVWDGTDLKRFATVPTGAEITGLHITANGVLFMNVQHPNAASIYPFNRGTVGVVNGFTADASFTELPLPAGDERRVARVAAGDYQVLGRAGDPIPGDPTGSVFGLRTQADGSTLEPCNKPDGNMFLPINEAGTDAYLYTDFECRPGGVTRLYIRQNEGGTWDVLQGDNVDFSSVNGTRYNCFASVTPWNTGLTSEEAEPRTDESWVSDLTLESSYLGRQANPYDYGWIVELAPESSPELIGTRIAKHYAMGRFSHEVALVMPDNKTVYFGDDATDGVFFKFVADAEGSLSAGTLYGAAVTQNDDGSFDVEWVELGSGNDEEIGAAIRALDPAG